MDTLEEARQRQHAAEVAAEEERLFYVVLYRGCPDLACQANEAACRAFIGSEPITEDAIHESITTLDAQGKLAHLDRNQQAERKAKQQRDAEAADQQEREQLIERLKQLHASETLLSKLKYLPTSQLKEKVAELESAAKVKNLSHDQLKKAATPPAHGGFPLLPVDISKADIGHMSVDEIKKLNKRYGRKQVNDRVSGADAADVEARIRQGFRA